MNDDIPQNIHLPLKRVCHSCGEEKILNAENFRPNPKRTGFQNPCRNCMNKRDTERVLKRYQDNPPVFDENILKECRDCHKLLPATPQHFDRCKRKRDGLNIYCKGCMAERHRISYSKDIEASRTYQRAQAAKHADWHAAYYQKHAEYIKQRQRTYYAFHRELFQQQERKRYHDLSKEKRQRKRELSNAWQRAHPEKKQVNKQTRRSRENAVQGTYTLKQIREQLQQQKYRCYYAACGHAKFKKRNGKYVYHIDHTFPISRIRGGNIPANNIDYLVLACPSCNVKKGNRFPWEWPEGGRLM